ncbi:hypothetical protein [Rhizorhapis sp. SPR117]|uniref:hypothetical protein n=1 Tax=Rhizorhapis sp. SPR117 TaxID=2912611 RepID=UPI001F2FFED0|nr:hypothetical protein [Rhizorhapis sp. SPR117]
MFERLTARAERLAAVRREQVVAHLAERVADDLPPDVSVDVGEDGLVLSGRNLLRRMLHDARLRTVGFLGQGDGG